MLINGPTGGGASMAWNLTHTAQSPSASSSPSADSQGNAQSPCAPPPSSSSSPQGPSVKQSAQQKYACSQYARDYPGLFPQQQPIDGAPVAPGSQQQRPLTQVEQAIRVLPRNPRSGYLPSTPQPPSTGQMAAKQWTIIAGETVAGAAIGSVVPVIGTATGAEVGALLGIGTSLLDDGTKFSISNAFYGLF